MMKELTIAALVAGATGLTKADVWDKTFQKSDKVEHCKATFKNRFGITLAADVYKPKLGNGERGTGNGRAVAPRPPKFAAIAVSGPFGAVKEQSSGLYAQTLAERGFLTIAFDPSYTGESSGEPRYVASPDINTEDFQAAVDHLVSRDDVDADKIGILGICGWGGLAINAAAIDTRVKATVASTMYDMTRVIANGYHPRSLNSTDGWNKTSFLSFLNAKLFAYADEIESAVMVVHGEKAHSRYFGETAFKKLKGDNKELVIVPGANHYDLYDGITAERSEGRAERGDSRGESREPSGKNAIPFDRIEAFYRKNLK